MGRAEFDQFAVITHSILDDDRRPLFVFRQSPIQPSDSGWSATLGEDPDDVPEGHFVPAHLGHLVTRWPELVPVFGDDRDDSGWAWDEDAGEYREIEA